jgi:lysophospholipase L1-like esterase
MKQTSALFLLLTAALPASAGWVTTWTAGLARPYTDQAQLNTAHLVFTNQTLRQIVHTSVGGDTVRVRISNVFGNAPLEIGSVHIALHTTASTIVAGSDKTLTFSGRSSFVIPPNGLMVSDPIGFAAPAGGDVVISMFFPKATNGSAIHYASHVTNYIGAGDQTTAATLRSPTSVGFWAFLAGLDIDIPDPDARTIVTLGDSITDGSASTTNANSRWPNILAARLLAAGMKNVSVANVGIGGNRVLHDAPGLTSGVSALARFGRDVLSQPGIQYLIILEGINDLGQPGTASAPLSESVTSDDVIAGLQQLANRAHEKGIKVFGCTLTPFAVATSAGYYSPEKDAYRRAVNDWIRSGAAFDGVIDFDLATRDPDHPESFLPDYDSGDHLHPKDAGYKAMGEAIDLSLFVK